MNDPLGFMAHMPLTEDNAPGATRHFALERATAIYIATYDSQAQIHKCQRCQLPDCVNCLGNGSRGMREEKNQQFLALYHAGKSDLAIAGLMGLKSSSIAYYRKKYGFAPNPATNGRGRQTSCI